jgi:glycine cleavage system H protein
LKYTREHEWVKAESDGSVTIGITDHAQHQLGDLVYVELPSVGAVCAAGAGVAVVESTKAASDVYAPLGGRVLAVNEALASAPESVNEDPYGRGWLMRLKPDEPGAVSQLLDAAAYRALVDTGN